MAFSESQLQEEVKGVSVSLAGISQIPLQPGRGNTMEKGS